MKTLKIVGSAVALAGVAALSSSVALADGHEAAMTAAQHAGLAAKAGDLATVHRHLHHVLNCLVGSGGEGFDASSGNPCAKDGGAIPQTADKGMMMKLEKAAGQARMGIADENVDAAKKAAMQIQDELK